MMNNKDLLSEIRAFGNELAILIDRGENITVEEVRDNCSDGNIIDLVHEKFGILDKEVNIRGLELLKEKIFERDLTKPTNCTNNGLVYLYTIVFEILLHEIREYKIWYEE